MRTSFFAAALLALAVPALAQTDGGARTVGRKGAVQLGVSFTTITQVSQTGLSATNMSGVIDAGRFVTEKFLMRFGMMGSGTIGGEQTGSTNFMGLAGALFYITPEKPSSFYLGGDITVPLQVQQEGAGFSGFANGRLGVQSAISNNASFFVEGGYGGALRSFAQQGSLMSNIGIRVLF
jgi:hypothetical protein